MTTTQEELAARERAQTVSPSHVTYDEGISRKPSEEAGISRKPSEPKPVTPAQVTWEEPRVISRHQQPPASTSAFPETGQSGKPFSVSDAQVTLETKKGEISSQETGLTKSTVFQVEELSKLHEIENRLRSFDPYIQGGSFVGTEQEYGRYKATHEEYQTKYQIISGAQSQIDVDIQKVNKNVDEYNLLAGVVGRVKQEKYSEIINLPYGDAMNAASELRKQGVFSNEEYNQIFQTKFKQETANQIMNLPWGEGMNIAAERRHGGLFSGEEYNQIFQTKFKQETVSQIQNMPWGEGMNLAAEKLSSGFFTQQEYKQIEQAMFKSEVARSLPIIPTQTAIPSAEHALSIGAISKEYFEAYKEQAITHDILKGSSNYDVWSDIVLNPGKSRKGYPRLYTGIFGTGYMDTGERIGGSSYEHVASGSELAKSTQEHIDVMLAAITSDINPDFFRSDVYKKYEPYIENWLSRNPTKRIFSEGEKYDFGTIYNEQAWAEKDYEQSLKMAGFTPTEVSWKSMMNRGLIDDIGKIGMTPAELSQKGFTLADYENAPKSFEISPQILQAMWKQENPNIQLSQAQQPVQQAQGTMLKNPFTGEMLYDTRPDPYAGVPGIPGPEWLATQRQQAQSKNIHRNAPVTAGLYEMSEWLTKQAQSGFGGVIGYSPTAHPGIKVLYGASSLITSIPQTLGMAGVVGEFAVRNPFKVPEAIVGGLPIMGGELWKQANTNPFETGGMVAGMIVGGKAIRIVSEKMPVVKVRGIEIPKGAGVAEEIKIPITQWKPSPENPVWTPGKGWSGGLEATKIPITQWKPSPSNPVWTPGKGWVVPAAGISGGLTYQGLSLEQGRKAQPIIGITDQPVTNIASLKIGDKTIVAGTPKFKPESVPEIYKSQFLSESGYRDFATPTEFNIAMKNIPQTYDPATRELLTSSLAKRELTYGVKSTHQLSDVPLEDVFTRHELGMATQKNLRTYMQQQKDFIIWGSTANKAQVMGKGGVGYFREVHDIDIHVKNPAQTTKELFAVISKTEKPGTVTMKGGGLVTKRGHLFDIKNIEGGMPEELGISASEIKKGNVFLFPEEPPGKIGKFTTQSLSSQATAKLSSLGLREKTVSAAPHRAGKDPFDLVFLNEPSLTKDMAKSLNPFKRMKAGKAEKLDIKIQELTEAKIGKQTIGSMPGDITAQQKKLFFDNLRALRAGQPVLAAPKSELLYAGQAARSKPNLPSPGNIMASGISAPSSQPHIMHEGGSYPRQPRLPSQKPSDPGSISRQIHQTISSQKMMFSPSRFTGSGGGSGRSGMGSVRIPGYYAGSAVSRSGISTPSGSGRIPVYPSGIVSPRSSVLSPPPRLGGSGQSGIGSVRIPGYYAGSAVSRSGGISTPSVSRRIPVFPRGSIVPPSISPTSPLRPSVYPRGGDFPSILVSPPSPPVSFGGGGMSREQFKLPKMPKFDNIGDVKKFKGRRSSSYEIKNPFSTLKDLVGDF